MKGASISPARGVLSKSRDVRLWIGPAVIVLGVAGGVLASRLSTTYVGAILVLALIIVVFLQRSGDPMIPFLLLVAAIQGGVLLQLPLGDGPIQTVAPIFGGWVVIAVLADRRRAGSATQIAVTGRWLPASLLAYAAVVALTAIIQSWRVDGLLLNVTEAFTLVQLAILVVISGYLLTSPQRVLWVGYVTIAAGVLTSMVALADSIGLLSLGTEMIYSEGYTRVSGLLGDPNYFSFQLLISLAFSLYLAVGASSRKGKVVFWLASVVLGAGIVSTYSAGALVGAAAIVITVILLQLRISTKRALGAFVAVLIVVGAVALLAPQGYGQVVTSKFSDLPGSSLEQLGTKRGAAWEAGVREVIANPMLGVGLSTRNTQLAIAEHYTLSSVERKAAHNMYIGVAVGAGLFGLAAFLAVLMSTFGILWSVYSRAAKVGDARIAAAVGCVLTAMVVLVSQGLQLDLEFEKYAWLLIGAALAIRRWQVNRGNIEA